MCGITGIFDFRGGAVERPLLQKMNDLLTHRGPDAEGFYLSGSVGLAMRRLKVIDLATGDQPIHNADESVWIVFNGEIYNYRELRAKLEKNGHRFYTHSDTEVVLHQYLEEGEKCVESLIGMFAIAIYDTKKDVLFIARDRLGIKPLFYHMSPRGFVFGSEIKPLLEVPWIERELDWQSLSHFFSLNYLPPPLTPFRGILQLEPGHVARVEKGRLEIKQYWDVPLETLPGFTEYEALETIEGLLHNSIERRLVADVPVGAFLSGGLDSSTLVALMKEHKHEVIKTFSVGFGDKAYDETRHAEEVAKYFGTEHYEIICKPQDVITCLPKIAWHADGLLADQAALPLYLVSALAKQHVTVSLSGDGGDEVFIGYPTFHADCYHAIYSALPRFLRKNVVEKMVNAIPASTGKLAFEYVAKKFIEAGDFTEEKAHYWWRTIFTDGEKGKLLKSRVLKQIGEIDAFPLYGKYFENAKEMDFFTRALYSDLKVWLGGNNLYKVDTMTMAHGLEARVPFLDHELVEYTARLPIQLRFRYRKLKYLFKKAVKHRLPESIFRRKKAGFHVPLAGWFREPLRDYVTDTLLADSPVLNEFMNREYISELLGEHFRGKRNHAFKIWGLLVFFHWFDGFGSGRAG